MARAAVVRLADRRSTPRSAVVNAAIEAQALAHELREEAEALVVEYGWADRDRRFVARLSRLVRTSVAIQEAAFLVAGAAEGIADPDGVVGPAHGRAS